MKCTRGLLALTVALCVYFVSGSAHAQCSKDTDCKGDRVCVNGTCEAPAPANAGSPAAAPVRPQPYPAMSPQPYPSAAVQPQCFRDSDCKGSRVCNNGLCMDSLATAGGRPHGRRGKTALTAGIILLSLGAVHATAGFAILGATEGDDDAAGAFVPNIAVGGTLMIIGTVLIPVGVSRLRRSERPVANSPASPPTRMTAFFSPGRHGGMVFGFGGVY